MLARYDALNGEALQRLVSGGTQLTAFSPEILTAAEKASLDSYEESASQDSGFREVYDSWKAFRAKVYAWNQINEMSFTTFAMRQPNVG